jgi:hypothetical protein
LNNEGDEYKTATYGDMIATSSFTNNITLLMGGIPALNKQLRNVEVYTARGELALNVHKRAVEGIINKGLNERSYRDLKIGGGTIRFLPEHQSHRYKGIKIKLDLKWTYHFNMIYN